MTKREALQLFAENRQSACIESADTVSDRDNACREKARTKDYEFDASGNPFIFICYITAAA